MKQKYGEIRELHFRHKEFAGWSCGGGVVVAPHRQVQPVRKPYYDYNNYYYYYFLHGDIYRESCYSCKYANTERPGDLTMGDFWGVESYGLRIDTMDGCSLVIASTEKGRKLLEQLSDAMVMVDVTMEQAVKANAQLAHPSETSTVRQQLAEQYALMDGVQMDAAFRKQHRKQIMKLHLKAMVPYKLKVKIRKLRK